MNRGELRFDVLMACCPENAFVCKKIKGKITPEINAKVEDALNDWFGVEYELVK